MLDRLPAWARHLLILILISPTAILLATGALAVITSGGVLTLDWGQVGSTAIDRAAVTAAGGVTAWLAMYVTPLTRQYGIGKSPPLEQVTVTTSEGSSTAAAAPVKPVRKAPARKTSPKP